MDEAVGLDATGYNRCPGHAIVAGRRAEIGNYTLGVTCHRSPFDSISRVAVIRTSLAVQMQEETL